MNYAIFRSEPIYTLNDLANQEVTVTITGEAPEGNSCVYVKNNEVIDYVLKYGNNIVTIIEEKNPEFFDGAVIADCNDTGKRQVLITYSIDSSAVATAPDGNLYDVKMYELFRVNYLESKMSNSDLHGYSSHSSYNC